MKRCGRVNLEGAIRRKSHSEEVVDDPTGCIIYVGGHRPRYIPRIKNRATRLRSLIINRGEIAGDSLSICRNTNAGESSLLCACDSPSYRGSGSVASYLARARIQQSNGRW